MTREQWVEWVYKQPHTFQILELENEVKDFRIQAQIHTNGEVYADDVLIGDFPSLLDAFDYCERHGWPCRAIE